MTPSINSIMRCAYSAAALQFMTPEIEGLIGRRMAERNAAPEKRIGTPVTDEARAKMRAGRMAAKLARYAAVLAAWDADDGQSQRSFAEQYGCSVKMVKAALKWRDAR